RHDAEGELDQAADDQWDRKEQPDLGVAEAEARADQGQGRAFGAVNQLVDELDGQGGQDEAEHGSSLDMDAVWIRSQSAWRTTHAWCGSESEEAHGRQRTHCGQ